MEVATKSQQRYSSHPVPGPIDILENGVTGAMSEDLRTAVIRCLRLNRSKVAKHSQKWTWENCWNIFRDNVVSGRQ